MKRDGSNLYEVRKERKPGKVLPKKGAGNYAKSRKVIKPPAQRIQRTDEWEQSSNDSIVEDKIALSIEGDERRQFTMTRR